ncbi:FAD-dependent monooxygenase [Singulisphaera sp. PoT]|uniref:FAD-dependent monooxygenase n=1 Tax=Singulisphaera sp. PoT TaxID=3411797 RepID=UPI003BF598EF
MREETTLRDVLIVGAGPTGLSLAITCRRFGLEARVIDRAPKVSEVSKALAVWSGSLEAFDAMGIIGAFLAEGVRMRGVRFGDGKHQLTDLEMGDGIDSPYPFPILLPQSDTERLLHDRLVELGGEVERDVELTAIEQDGDGVTATLKMPEGREERSRFAFVVGCDGARSVVRHQLQVPFEGYTEERTFVLCDAKLQGDLDPTHIHVWWHGGGSVALFPIRDGIWRVFSLREAEAGDETPTLEEMQHFLDAHGPENLRLIDPTWLSAFRINERLAAHYRVGRCFLAGDAAHVHSPAGGQGMNTGIQDGVNLGWKLAQVLQGVGEPDLLLDSYEAERRPVAREVVEGAGQMLHVAFGNNPLLRIAKDVLIPILSHVPALKRKLQVRLSETAIVYHDGPLVQLGGVPHAHAARGEAGTRALDAALRDPATGRDQRLWSILAGAHHTLLLFGDGASLADAARIAATAGDRLKTFTIDSSNDPDGHVRKRYGIENPGWILVRPDQVIAARGEADDTARLEAYVARVLLASAS